MPGKPKDSHYAVFYLPSPSITSLQW